ncbi:AMP-binding protein [Kibdelosporangium phytohabitans]|uniref:Acyl-CoA synthetase n=1 Tax=Kibdelosporangium phytohabitans TaxID=860235 RepID=A0A0N9HZ33_9PSEU|nr:AMP-binding protein [Kibdelosporangium phytohabitans]ALG12577.1 acyl-CoA synthetase [Kibdelosporangium phytohabitans]MBE1464201.1 acyl-coenzyme A synthetase/AMP-(fatty) acid ligase [Kibdelosporangium phytohabitans]
MSTFRERLLTQVSRRPGAPALVWHGEVTTYGELYELADKARARLEWSNLQPGEPIGLLVKKSPQAVALVLGAVLSGRRFLLPSPALANSALTSLFAQAGCQAVYAPEGEPEFVPDPEVSRPAVEASDVDGVRFMLTTSGSTGLPKIVPLPQQGIDRFVEWAGAEFDIRPGRTVLNYAPLNFDLCLLDIWTTLAHGGRVVLVDPDYAANGRHLLDMLVRHEVNVIQAVPMFFGLLLDVVQPAVDRLESVDRVMFTGDAIPDRTLAELPNLFPRASLHNIYGCTETNDSFIHHLGTDATAPVSIGTPLPGVHTLVMTAEGTVLEGPGTGELYVSTPFQAAGYLDRTRHTDKFVPHPAGADERPWFRSGDLVRRAEDGRVYLIGRSDFQVKVRGVAINTAEVEHVLLEHPAVLEAAVVAVPDPIAGRRLVAAVRRAGGSKLNSLILRQHCARRLPQAAIPSAMHIADEPLPKTPTGKVDRNAFGSKGRNS